MRYEKTIDFPDVGFVSSRVSRTVGQRVFYVCVAWVVSDDRRWVAHRLRNARQYLREVDLEEPEKVVDFPKVTCIVPVGGNTQ